MPFLFWLFAKAAMGWRKPKVRILGNELAGDVVSVGWDVKRFKPGDRVFGHARSVVLDSPQQPGYPRFVRRLAISGRA